MQKLETIQHGAILIRNGIVESIGPANRIENLAEAKSAIEINVTGKLVMPAFVEPDASIYSNPVWPEDGEGDHGQVQSLRTCSRQKLQSTALKNSLEYARYGAITAGTATVFARELKVLMKLLRTQQALQSKPLRHRAIIAPDFCCETSERLADQVVNKWIPIIRERRFSSIVEVVSSAFQCSQVIRATEAIARAAAASGFSLRVRSVDGARSKVMELAPSAGVRSVIAPARMGLLGSTAAWRNAVIVLSMNHPADMEAHLEPEVARLLIDRDFPLALSMGSPLGPAPTRNMQHALHVAWCYYGLTAEEAICAATVNAAWSLGSFNTSGSLEPGKPADFMIMDVPHYQELVRRPGNSSVETVLRGGKVIYQRTPLILD